MPLLKIVPVKLAGPSSCVDTHALLDEGSTISLIDAGTAKRIGATGPQVVLALRVIGTPEAIETVSQRVTVDISGPFRTHTLEDVHLLPDLSLPAQTITERMVSAHTHLAGLGIASYTAAACPR